MDILCCPECKNDGVKLHENLSQKKGFALLLFLKFQCGFKREFYTSRSCGKRFDIIRRLIYSIGHGYSVIEKFTTLMNLPRPIIQKSYDSSVKVIEEAMYEVAEDTTIEAANELKKR